MFDSLRNWLMQVKRANDLARRRNNNRTQLNLTSLEDRVVLTQQFPNVTPDLEGLFNNYSNSGNTGFTPPANSRFLFRNDKIKVTVRGKEGTNFNALLASLQSNGFERGVTDMDLKITVGYLPMDKIPTIATLPGAPAIIPHYRPFSKSVGLESNRAEELHKANLLRNTFNLTGRNVTIGVISDSINQVGNGVFDSFKTGDLPNIGPQLQILADGPAGSSDEGRAMAELIHDIAPNARILFHTSGTSDIEFASAVRRLANAGANIIVDDISTLDEPWFQEPLTGQAIQSVFRNQNVAYFSAAGNYGDSGWQTPFRGSNDTWPGTFQNLSGTWHQFGTVFGNQPDILQTVLIPPRSSITVLMQYDDPTVGGEGIRRNVDFYLFNDQVNGILASGLSINQQTLTPSELLTYTNGSDDFVTGFLAVRMTSGYDLGWFQYVDFDNNLIIVDGKPNSPFIDPVPGARFVTTTGDHVVTPETVAVGAVENPNVYQKVQYSSYGRGIRVFDNAGNRIPPQFTDKVDVMGESGIRTSISGFRPFSGTSAAAPNIAAVAALIWEFNRSITNQQLVNTIKSTAEDIIDPHPQYTFFGGAVPDGTNRPGYDIYSGFGIVDGMSAVLSLNGGILTINGDRSSNINDSITLRTSISARHQNAVDVILNGTLLGTVRRSQFLRELRVNGGFGNDSFTVDVSNGAVNTNFTIVYDGGADSDTVTTVGDSNYNLSFTSLTIGTLPPIALNRVENASLTGGSSANTFTLQNWQGNVTFNGLGASDTYNINLSNGVSNIRVNDTVAGGNDSVNLFGSAGDDTMNLRVSGALASTGSLRNGTSENFDYLGIETLNINGGNGTNSLALTDATATSVGTPTGTADGFIYNPSSATGGRITARLGATPSVINFTGINQNFSFTGGTGTARTTLKVTGITSTTQTTSPLAETTTADGSDIINVSDSAISIRNATGGQLRGLSLSSVSNLVIFGGNEALGGGDTITATPSRRTNIVIDGGNPVAGGGGTGDSLRVDTVGARTTVDNINNPSLGPVGHSRIYQSLDDASVGFQGFESVTGTTRADSIYALASGGGRVGQVAVYDARTNAQRYVLTPFPGYTGGLRVAVGDITGDGVQDIIVSTAPGVAPRIRVIDGRTRTVVRDVVPVGAVASGGVNVAVGDVNNDGRADLITAVGGGASPRVVVYSGTNFAVIRNFLAFGAGFLGGVSVAAADIDLHGSADIVVGSGPGVTPQVKVFSGASLLPIRDFLAFGPGFRGGINVTAGDITGDGVADIVTAPMSGSTNVKVFNGADLTVLANFFVNDPFNPNVFIPTARVASVNVALVDTQGTGGRQLVIGRGPVSRAKASVYAIRPSLAFVRDINIFETTFGGGVFVGASS